ncbi:hypothetical protein SAMN05446927_4699 [Caballeronia arationis]|uniref:Uncharacterized protein n=1 Tax=Caballeronia arationis TaxID=1777142 RepID=A0A7Z7N4R5_9BURK|nr:hypothetical protein [Caballeronia arationis]SOE81417.1 hypothetical protein SAMN05446927_4699 [Caballeronia arationis]
MKPMSRLACGIVVSVLYGVAIAQAQLQPEDLSVQASARAAVPGQQDVARARDFSPPAPRGDLRGDIASNVRVRPDDEHEERPRRH